jgi:ABC-type sugar transport system substrate-binding protein
VSTTFNAQQRTLGFQDAMKDAGANVVSVQSGQWEIDQGNTVAASMLNANPDIKAMLAGNDNMAWAPCPPSAPLARPARCNWSATTTSTPSSRC